MPKKSSEPTAPCHFINMNNFYFSGHSIVDFAYGIPTSRRKSAVDRPGIQVPGMEQGTAYVLRPLPQPENRVHRLVRDAPERGEYGVARHREELQPARLLLPRIPEPADGHEVPRLSVGRNPEQPRTDSQRHPLQSSPLDYMQDYMHHGFYPFFLEKRNFSENLLKTMNMMVEVDILLIKQIELKYLSKIKKLLYLLAVDGPKAPNVSQLANDIQTSRATVMNYIKYLADARLINMVYPKGEEFPKKPSKIMMHNSNLMYSIYPVKVEEQDVLDTFFANTMWKDHKVNKGDKNISFMVDEVMPFKICPEGTKIKNNPGVTYVLHKAEIGRGNQIPLWLFGFLY